MFLAGGTYSPDGSPRAYIYNKDVNEWRAVGDMNRGREYHSCGLVPSTSEVVVVGGIGAESFEIFSIETETWRPGMHSNIATRSL